MHEHIWNIAFDSDDLLGGRNEGLIWVMIERLWGATTHGTAAGGLGTTDGSRAGGGPIVWPGTGFDISTVFSMVEMPRRALGPYASASSVSRATRTSEEKEDALAMPNSWAKSNVKVVRWKQRVRIYMRFKSKRNLGEVISVFKYSSIHD